jgi:hypothetical protein
VNRRGEERRRERKKQVFITFKQNIPSKSFLSLCHMTEMKFVFRVLVLVKNVAEKCYS